MAHNKKKKEQHRKAVQLPTHEPDEKWIFAILVGIFILMIVWGLLSDSTWDDDCAMRYYNTCRAFEDPEQFIRLWNRPLFVLLFVLSVYLGKHVIVFQMALISIITCYALYLAAKTRKIPNAYLIIPFTAFQAFYFPISFNALAEPLAACIMALGVLFYARKKYLAFAIVGSLLPLARLELSPLLAIWAIVLILEKQWKYIPIFIIPTLLWNFAGTILDGDPLWLYNHTIGADQGVNKYGQTSFWSYFHRFIFVVGPVVFYFMLIGLFENVYKRKADWFVTIQFLAGFLIYVVFSWKLSLGQAAGFLRHLISLSPLVAYLALIGYNYWLDFEVDKQRRVRVLIYSVIILILTALFLSRKLVMHHVVIQEPEYIKLVIISLLTLVFVMAAYIDRSLFKNSAIKVVLSILIVGTVMGYTLVTEPPNNNDSAERRVMKQVSKWYVDNNLLERKTYANHVWFFYASDLDYNSDHFERVTEENLDNAPPSSIVIWESHYSHRLFGDVQLDYFKDNPKFKQITQIVTPDKRFAVFIFQAVS